MPDCWPCVIQSLASGAVNGSVLATHEPALEEFEYGLNLVHAGTESLKVLLKPSPLLHGKEEVMTRRENAAARRIKDHIANLGSRDEKVARRAEGSLIRYYGSRALGPLIEACSDMNVQVRDRAVWALGKTRDPRAYETILRLTSDPQGYVRYDAAIALGVLGDERATTPLIALMQTPDEQHSVDVAAAMGLDRLGKPTVSALLDVLQNSTNEVRVRCLAASVLGDIADRRAIEPLAGLLSDSDEDMRVAAIEALAQIGDKDCLILIQRCLEDPAPEVRENAEHWVKEIKSE